MIRVQATGMDDAVLPNDEVVYVVHGETWVEVAIRGNEMVVHAYTTRDDGTEVFGIDLGNGLIDHR